MARVKEKTNTALEALECLEALALEKGLDSLSMRDVAKRVGIKLASLQYHYPSKAELIDAFIEYKIAEYGRDIDVLLASGEPDAIEMVIRYTIKETFAATGRSLYAMIEARAQHDESAARALQRFMKWYLGRFRAMIASHRPALANKDALLKATIIISLLEGLTLTHEPARALGLSRAALTEAAARLALATLEDES